MKHMDYLLILLLFFLAQPVFASDARISAREADRARAELAQKAMQEKVAAEQAAKAARAAIFRDRKSLEEAVANLKDQKKKLDTSIARLLEEEKSLTEKESELDSKISETDGMIKELVGQIRINAKDLDELLSQDPQNLVARNGENRLSFLSSVAGDEKFPSMHDIQSMETALLDIIRRTGQVNLTHAPIIGRGGEDSMANVLLVGPFTASYMQKEETGFLNFSPGNDKLFALSNLPSGSMQKQIQAYMTGNSSATMVDLSRGGALRQISHRVDFMEQIRLGGPIVYPILALFVVGLFIVLERTFYLVRNRQAKPSLISELRRLAQNGNWADCEKLCVSPKWRKKPMGRVLAAGLAARKQQREEIENALQEGILAEIPRLERGLSALGILTSIAPLLGLLGTVTGMINVFHVITLYGASDPRMMSSGISEALVTTMLGLAVAIPLMLLHNTISRGVDRIIGSMEEQSVGLVNLIYTLRLERKDLKTA